ncbi:MAG: hypothetical protein LBU86_04730 [Oscillospiraceae bacterium]|jgi:anti-sigma28 factor (negative regulator of flagellin synthesis)|nr:hypothetical protein [Oscillospiraceae bacterium]
MKIEPGSGIGIYRAGKPAGAPKRPEAAETARTDIAEFSHGASSAPGRELSGVKARVMVGLGRAADPGKIESLRQSVKDGAYRVSTDDIVKAILGE